MREQEIINKTIDGPLTISTLVRDLDQLGLKAGMTLIVHSSLSSLGWVCGGPAAVILALEQVLTESGTLVMPAHSGDLSDPKNWQHPPVPTDWVEPIRAAMPPFSQDLTPIRGLGIIPEVFRKQAGVVRSNHPQLSFSAWGKQKEYIIQDEHYDHAMNQKSPLGRLYELDAYILLIGVGHDSNTSLHLAEYLADYPRKQVIKNGMPILEDGVRVWREFEDILIDSDDFSALGADYEAEHEIQVKQVGNAPCRLIRMRPIVDYAVTWMERTRV